MKNGVASVRAGATLLYDSNAESEELETELKASAMIDAIIQGVEDGDKYIDETSKAIKDVRKIGYGKNIVLIDNEDSFVHTLGNYLWQTGDDVKTLPLHQH